MSENINLEGKELLNEELENVSGGKSIQKVKIACSVCGTVNEVNVMNDRYVCSGCRKTHYIMG